jgi:hypothetical protein
VPQQVAVKLAVAGQQMVFEQADDRPRLSDVAERRRIGLELIHPTAKPTTQRGHRIIGRRVALLDDRPQRVEVSQKSGIARAAGKIQIADNLL